ncbi:MAG: hypothetical protein ABIS36_01385 [Chryseolinea sp.]
MAYCGCQKPKHINGEILRNELTANVTEVSINDTMPAKFVQVLNLAKTSGLQFDYGDRHLKTYFEYHCDRSMVLNALAQLGFSKNSALADTKCRPVDPIQFVEMRDAIREEERNQADFFWGIVPGVYDIYECIKTPSRHLVLIEKKNSDKILHLVIS